MNKKDIQRIPGSGKMKHITYERAFHVVKTFEQALAAERFDLILGIARSGVVPAVMVSQTIDVPVEFVQCGRTETPRFLGSPPELKGKKILVVDDIIGLGLTMRAVVEFVKKLGGHPVSFCLYFDKETTQFRPDFGHSTSHFMHAQWDRKDVTPQSRKALKEKNGRCTTEDTYECFGTDLDGVFLEDIKRKAYRLEERIASILAYRDSLMPMESIPVTDHQHVYVITGRPETDRQRTRAWLNKHGFAKAQLVCRNTAEYGSGLKEMARFKADQIINIGISKYFESDLMQAVLIAQKALCTDIYWWGKEDKIRIYANPVTHPFVI